MLRWYQELRLAVRVCRSCLRGEEGAVSIEYVGLGTIAAAIIVAVLEKATGIGSALVGVIMTAIGNVGG